MPQKDDFGRYLQTVALNPLQDPVPERPIRANPGLVLLRCYILPLYVLLRVTFCVIIIESRSKDSTIFCKLELHVLSQENLA